MIVSVFKSAFLSSCFLRLVCCFTLRRGTDIIHHQYVGNKNINLSMGGRLSPQLVGAGTDVLLREGVKLHLLFQQQEKNKIDLDDIVENRKSGKSEVSNSSPNRRHNDNEVESKEVYMGDLVKLMKGNNNDEERISGNGGGELDNVGNEANLGSIIGIGGVIVVAVISLVVNSLGIR